MCRSFRFWAYFNMSRAFKPPAYVRGITELDRKLFDVPISLPAMRVPSTRISEALSVVTPYLFRMVNLKAVIDVESEDYKEVLLDPDILAQRDLSVKSLKHKITSVYQAVHDSDILEYHKNLVLTYDNWSSEDIFDSVLPEGEHLNTFSTVGHIVHVNIRDQILPFKYLIGSVLLDKVKAAKTVVNKTEPIDNTFRTFNMEVLAGEPNFIVEVIEYGCRYKFDFSKVYWNPRLSTEHHRVFGKLKKGDTLYDVCAGVGPFAIPAAKHSRCRVIANDLNPDCIHWLEESAKLNKVEVTTTNLDAGEFIRNEIRNDLVARTQDPAVTRRPSHVVLNLPSIAVTFMGNFVGLCQGANVAQEFLHSFYVHCYAFSREENAVQDCKRQVEFYLGASIEDAELKPVRDVAPYKMLCRVSCRIPEEVLLGLVGDPLHPSAIYQAPEPVEPPTKRSKATLPSPQPSSAPEDSCSSDPLISFGPIR